MPLHRPRAAAFLDRDGPPYAPRQPSSSSSGRARADAGPRRASLGTLAASPVVSHLPPGYARRNPDAPGSAPPVLPVPRVAADVPLGDVPLRPTAPAHPPGSPLRPPMSSSQVGSTLSPSSTLRGSLGHGLDSSLPPPSILPAVHVHTPVVADAPVPVPVATPTPTPFIWLGPNLTPSPWPMPSSSAASRPLPSPLSRVPSSWHPPAALTPSASNAAVPRPAGSMLAEASMASIATDPRSESDSDCHPPGVSPIDDGRHSALEAIGRLYSTAMPTDGSSPSHHTDSPSPSTPQRPSQPLNTAAAPFQPLGLPMQQPPHDPNDPFGLESFLPNPAPTSSVAPTPTPSAQPSVPTRFDANLTQQTHAKRFAPNVPPRPAPTDRTATGRPPMSQAVSGHVNMDQAASPSPTSSHAPPPPPPTPSQAEAARAAAVRDRQPRPSANSAAPTFDRVHRLPDDAQAALLADKFRSSLPTSRGSPQVQYRHFPPIDALNRLTSEFPSSFESATGLSEKVQDKLVSSQFAGWAEVAEKIFVPAKSTSHLAIAQIVQDLLHKESTGSRLPPDSRQLAAAASPALSAQNSAASSPRLSQGDVEPLSSQPEELPGVHCPKGCGKSFCGSKARYNLGYHLLDQCVPLLGPLTGSEKAKLRSMDMADCKHCGRWMNH